MEYSVVVSPAAERHLRALERVPEYERIRSAFEALGKQPRPPGSQKLAGRPAWRIRVGDYRIIYEIEDRKLIVVVVRVAHRSKAY